MYFKFLFGFLKKWLLLIVTIWKNVNYLRKLNLPTVDLSRSLLQVFQLVLRLYFRRPFRIWFFFSTAFFSVRRSRCARDTAPYLFTTQYVDCCIFFFTPVLDVTSHRQRSVSLVVFFGLFVPFSLRPYSTWRLMDNGLRRLSFSLGSSSRSLNCIRNDYFTREFFTIRLYDVAAFAFRVLYTFYHATSTLH